MELKIQDDKGRVNKEIINMSLTEFKVIFILIYCYDFFSFSFLK